eukprot:1869200-Amphidinium_carterae.1
MPQMAKCGQGSQGQRGKKDLDDPSGQAEKQFLGESGEAGADTAFKWWEFGEKRSALSCQLQFVSHGGALRHLLRSPSSSCIDFFV